MRDLGSIKFEDYEGTEHPEEVRRAIVSQVLLYWDDLSRFWAPSVTLGKKCWDAVVGNIFSDSEMAEFARQDKIVLKVPYLVPKINALEGMQIAGRRDGIIVPIGDEDAPDAQAANHILKHVQRKNNYSHESTCCFTNHMVSSMPSFMWYDKEMDSDFCEEIVVRAEPWDAVFPDKGFTRMDLSDCRRMVRLRAVDKDKLKEMFPEQSAEIDRRFRSDFDVRGYMEGGAWTSTDRDALYRLISSARETVSKTGQVYVIEYYSMVNKRVNVFISPKTEKPEMLPPDWNEKQIQKWMQLHPNYQKVELDVPNILWVTTVTSSGLLLQNRRHWFQEGEFPCEMFYARMWNQMPHGVIEFLLGSLKGRNVTKMEELHSLRLANDQLVVIKEGAVTNIQDAIYEKSRPGGTIVRSRMSQDGDISFPENRRENTGWRDAADSFMEDLHTLSVNPNFEGMSQGSQESGRAIDRRNQQTQMKYSPHISAYNMFHLRCTRKILLCIPIVKTEEEIVRYVDPAGSLEEIGINQPVEYDWFTGAATKLKNNLKGARYDYIEAEGDNSATAREFELIQFNEILSNLARWPDSEMWPTLLLSTPNRMAQEFGQKLQQAQQAKAQQGPQKEPIKLAMSINGDQTLHNPIVQSILAKEGIISPEELQALNQQTQRNQQMQQMPPEQVQAQQTGQAAMQPQTSAQGEMNVG